MALDTYLIGIDGEGQTNAEGKHIYTLLAWSDELGRRRDYVGSNTGLSSVDCLDFLLRIPVAGRPFAFAFNYDLTMILRDVDDKVLYALFRPELRATRKATIPVKWNGYTLNLMGTKFTVSRGTRKTVVWDTFRFYQAKFVTALRQWKVGNEADIARMELMKNQRGTFDTLNPDDVREYCFSECAHMAALTRKLIESHDKAGLPLKSFYGAGSTASVLLKSMLIHKQRRDGPDEMLKPVAQAFFGGRFENRIAGPVNGRVYSFDISSAYPYQLFRLPCLDCGQWVRTKHRKALETTSAALVRYRLWPSDNQRISDWGPFPFRLADGSIVFPGQSGGGWLWRDEYLAGEKHWPGVQFIEAWVYNTSCQHRPFADIPNAYVQRLKWGKEGPGIVMKLGCNSCYGKLAQSVGRSRPFRSMIWAGMVTSGCRAQLLDAIARHKDRRNCLMLATDGIYTREDLQLPEPIETGTMTEHKKPLGGWERKVVEHGIFAARPGVYFPLGASDADIEAFRARGIGRKELYSSWRKIVDAWERNSPSVVVGSVVRFNGAKSSINVRKGPVRWECNRSERYGQWTPRPIEMSFNPLPKRAAIEADGSLRMRYFGPTLESIPYNRALQSPDAMLLRALEMLDLEQPQ